jgi:hypothetical protein
MRISSDQKEVTLPDFLIAGTAKSGTTSLYHYLKSHPDIFLPEMKEPYFFILYGTDTPVQPDLLPWTLDAYSRLFATAKENAFLGEATPRYLFQHEKSIANIKAIYKDRYRDLKIIAILRNPMGRAWSYYMLLRKRGYDLNFFEACKRKLAEEGKRDPSELNFIREGLYCDQIEAYRRTFPHLKIVLFEEFNESRQAILRDLFAFLGLDDTDYVPDNVDEVYNISGRPKNALSNGIFRFMHGESRMKRLGKRLIPYDLRQKLMSQVSKRILVRERPGTDVWAYLRDIYLPDMERLKTVFADTKQADIVQAWIQDRY